MDHTTKYKAFVLKQRAHDGAYIFCNIGWKLGITPEFIHSNKPNLFPVEYTIERYGAHYAGAANELFKQQFHDWHEMIDCELVIKDSAASQVGASQSGE